MNVRRSLVVGVLTRLSRPPPKGRVPDSRTVPAEWALCRIRWSRGPDGNGNQCQVPSQLAAPLPLFVKAKVTIDGRSEVRGWGRHFFPTSPGSHEVSVSFPWRGGPHPEASTTLNVAAGEQVSLEYRTPLMLGLAFVGKPALRVISHGPV